MQTHNKALLDLLGQPGVTFVIPAYQRSYSWQERECKELWLDLHRAAKSGAKHFAGTFLYSLEPPKIAVIDGQQRLTTVTLVLIALMRLLRSRGGSVGGMTAADINRLYLTVDCAGESEPVGKLVLSRNDRGTLFAVVRDMPLPPDASTAILSNLAMFEGLMQEEGFDPEALWKGLQLMTVVAARIEVDDPAQHIFESLNSKGLPLTTADLVRNYLLLAESHEARELLYDRYWETIEGVFQPDPGSLRLDNAIQGWLSVRFRKVRAKGAGEVYSVFKRYMEEEFTGTTESLLRELRNFCMVWAENYRYHAVKKYRSAGNWAVNGAPTLTAGYERKAPENQHYADRLRRELGAEDATL